MPRMRLYFKGKKDFKFPKNYDDLLLAILSQKIRSFGEMEAEFKNFTFYTFSNFVIEIPEEHDNYILSAKGMLSVVISSVSEEFLRKLLAFIVDGNPLYFKGNVLRLDKFEFIESVRFSEECSFVTVSPVLLKNFPNGGDIFSFLENILAEKYSRYYNVSASNISCRITTHGDNFQRFVEGGESGDHFYMMDLHIEGDKGIISFAYDVGLGCDNSMGFGMLDLY